MIKAFLSRSVNTPLQSLKNLCIQMQRPYCEEHDTVITDDALRVCHRSVKLQHAAASPPLIDQCTSILAPLKISHVI